jgi:hypothetical protein
MRARVRRGAAGRGELDCMNLRIDCVQGSGGEATGGPRAEQCFGGVPR